MKFHKGEKIAEKLPEYVMFIGEQVLVSLLHKKIFRGKLVSIFSRDRDMNCLPYDVIYFRFMDVNGLEKIIVHPDILDMERIEDA